MNDLGDNYVDKHRYRDDLTREKFVKDSYSEFLGLPDTALLYRTGDLGRWISDGSIEYLGRKDFQVKLRGFRVELSEIETALGSYCDISHTAVLLKGEGESAYLAAYYTSSMNGKVEISELIAHLKSFLPEYMIPKTFTKLSSFPMTVNGKIDKEKIYLLEDVITLRKSIVPLSSEVERQISDIWRDVLNIKIDCIGADSNFFELGGNSLLVIKMLSKLNQAMNSDLDLSQFIVLPTIKTLSSQFDRVEEDEDTNSLLKQLQSDSVLDKSIQPLLENNENIFNPKNILLTGATGFLGAHILNELLLSSDANIYCLVKDSSNEHALNRIIANLKKYKLEGYNYNKRIYVVLGNLDEEKLGLSNNDFSTMQAKIDSIFHVGALVHHIYDYNTLYKPNVRSVYEVLLLAVTGKNKAIHFISTLAALLISPIKNSLLPEEGALGKKLNFNGYLTSKWIAERLLEQAHDRGIAAYIYRPGNIIAGSSGVYEPYDNHTLLRLKGMLQLGKGFVTEHETVEMMPVDLLSKNIVEISNNPDKVSYNMNNPQTISWIQYLEIAINKGYQFHFLHNVAQWNELMDHLDEKNALYKLSYLYKKQSVDNECIVQKDIIMSDCSIIPPSYKEMIELQLVSLVKQGFLEPPGVVKQRVI